MLRSISISKTSSLALLVAFLKRSSRSSLLTIRCLTILRSVCRAVSWGVEVRRIPEASRELARFWLERQRAGNMFLSISKLRRVIFVVCLVFALGISVVATSWFARLSGASCLASFSASRAAADGAPVLLDDCICTTAFSQWGCLGFLLAVLVDSWANVSREVLGWRQI